VQEILFSLLIFFSSASDLFDSLFLIEYHQQYQIYKDNIQLDETELKEIISRNIKNKILLYDYAQKHVKFDENLYFQKIFLLKKQYNTKNLVSIAVKTRVPVKIILQTLKMDTYIELLYKKIFKNIKVTDKEIENYYYSHLDEFKINKKILLYHIFSVSKPKIIKIKQKIDKKEITFQEAAYRYSEAPEKQQKGFIGFVTSKDLPSYFKPAFSLKSNKYSDIIESDIGYHIFYVKKTIKNKYEDLENAKNRIYIKLLETKQQKKLNELIKSLNKEKIN